MIKSLIYSFLSISSLYSVLFLIGSVSGSGTGPLDSQATDPDPETLLWGLSQGPVVHFNVPICVDIPTNTLNLLNSYEIVIIFSVCRHVAQAE